MINRLGINYVNLYLIPLPIGQKVADLTYITARHSYHQYYIIYYIIIIFLDKNYKCFLGLSKCLPVSALWLVKDGTCNFGSYPS